MASQISLHNRRLIHLANREMLCYLEPTGLHIKEFDRGVVTIGLRR